MENLIIRASQTPGIVTFENFEEVKAALQQYVQETFPDTSYSELGIDTATADRDECKKVRDVIAKKQKELKEAYSAPFVAVEDMLDELIAIIDVPYKRAKAFVDDNYKIQKQKDIMAYAALKAAAYGAIGQKIIESPAFFKKDWLLHKYTEKIYRAEINQTLQQAKEDIRTLQAAGGDNASVLIAHYYETLSMDGVKRFTETLTKNQSFETIGIASSHNAMGYKVLKITATEDQLACIFEQLKLMGVEVEEMEDGMPKAMRELTVPDFNTFVAFDIEASGTYGVANGDTESQITEIGAVKVVNGKIVDRFDELANPGRSIVPMVAHLTHITNEMVADKPPVPEVVRRFHDFVGNMPLIGHNIKSSDLRYIIKAADKAGVHFNMPFLDTYLLAKKCKETMGWVKLTLPYLANYYGYVHKEVHRAWSDAEVNAMVYFELQKLFKQL